MKKIVITCVALLMSFAIAQSAQAAVLAAVLRNDTNITITYQAKLNNGPWKTYTLRPGQALAYSLPYPSSSGSTIYLRYDGTLGDGRVVFANTTLVMHVCDRPGNGWLQRFIIVNSGRNLTIAR